MFCRVRHLACFALVLGGLAPQVAYAWPWENPCASTPMAGGLFGDVANGIGQAGDTQGVYLQLVGPGVLNDGNQHGDCPSTPSKTLICRVSRRGQTGLVIEADDDFGSYNRAANICARLGGTTPGG